MTKIKIIIVITFIISAVIATFQPSPLAYLAVLITEIVVGGFIVAYGNKVQNDMAEKFEEKWNDKSNTDL